MYLLNEIEAPSPGQHRILESTSVNGKPQVTIKAVLQTCGDVNKNKRIYPKEVLQEAIAKIKPMMEQNALTGELDHPVPTGSSETDSYRHFVVLYDRTSHIIQDMYFEGNTIYGIVKTTSTDKGYNMAGLISDGVPVGFSLRAMGESTTNSSGITTIKAPLNFITYDCVSNPSHAKARMLSIVKENICPRSEDGAKALIENAFGAVTLDRSNLLLSYNTYDNTSTNSLDSKLQELFENINAITKSSNSNKNLIESAIRNPSQKINKRLLRLIFESYLKDNSRKGRLLKQIAESYINDDDCGLSNKASSYVHDKILNYLTDFINPKKSSDRFTNLYDAYFKKD